MNTDNLSLLGTTVDLTLGGFRIPTIDWCTSLRSYVLSLWSKLASPIRPWIIHSDFYPALPRRYLQVFRITYFMHAFVCSARVVRRDFLAKKPLQQLSMTISWPFSNTAKSAWAQECVWLLVEVRSLVGTQPHWWHGSVTPRWCDPCHSPFPKTTRFPKIYQVHSSRSDVSEILWRSMWSAQSRTAWRVESFLNTSQHFHPYLGA